MRWIDELPLNHPFAGAWMLRDFLGLEGVPVGRRHVSTLMVIFLRRQRCIENHLAIGQIDAVLAEGFPAFRFVPSDHR
jgi:hypothetical protein